MKKSVVLIALLAACAPAEDKQDTPQGRLDTDTRCGSADLTPVTSEARAVADASNAFAVDLYGAVTDTSDGQENLFFSPFSIASALGMTLAGAEGETEQQMRAVFHIGDDEAAHHAAYAELRARVFGKPADCPSMDLTMANRLFGQEDYPWLEAFLQVTELDYGAGLEELDFVGAPESARVHINDWVAEQTEDRIEDLLPEGSVTEGTRLVLANAIYFLGDWEDPFDAEQTGEAPFTRADGSVVPVPMMMQETEARVAWADGALAVELDYMGGRQSMVVVMPEDPAVGLDAVSAFVPARLSTIEENLAPVGDIWLGLPRFEFSQETDLKAMLQELGMVDAFVDGAADFTDMADMEASSESLFISGAFHKAFISVDEKGTEAAAATAVVVGTESAPSVNFIADRPFEFYIRDNVSGAILFMGRVHDPSAP